MIGDNKNRQPRMRMGAPTAVVVEPVVNKPAKGAGNIMSGLDDLDF